MWGLEHSTPAARLERLGSRSSKEELPKVTVVTRIARYSYGVAVSWPFEPGKHVLSDKVWDPASNSWKADNQVYWLIEKVLDLEYVANYVSSD